MRSVREGIAAIVNKVRRMKWAGDRRDVATLDSRLGRHDLVVQGDSSPFETLSPVLMQDTSDQPREEWLRFDNVKMDRSIPEYMKDDGFPIPSSQDREGYFGDRHYHYWLSGLKDYLSMKQVIAERGEPLDKSSVVLDLGCASGRVLRHFACHGGDLGLWGTDINPRHIEWIRRFLAPSIRVFPNTILPHLPLEDNSISLVYAFSVFTHIDEFELSWIAEVRRILKRGGFAYLTIHSDYTWAHIESARPLYNNLLAMKEYIHDHNVTPELFKKPMSEERMVFKWTTASAYNSNVFHSVDYIKSAWGRFLEVVDIIREGHNYQDVVILRKN